MKPIISFDLDGTLSNTWPIALTAFRCAIRDAGAPDYTDEELREFAGPSEDGILRQMLPDAWEICFEDYVNRFGRKLETEDVTFEGIAELLSLLHASGCRLAVKSGKTGILVEMTLKRLGLRDLFSEVASGSPEGHRKAEYLLELRRRLNLSPRSIAYVGDTVDDILAARAAGVIGLGAAWNQDTEPQALVDSGAEAVFRSTEEFRKWVRA